MIPEATPLLLDTNIVIHLTRGAHAAEELERRFSLGKRRRTPSISIVSVGEALAFAHRLGWGEPKRHTLRTLLGNLVVEDINNPAVLDAYAEIDAHVTTSGNPMGKNDLWIAATARATGATILTTDKDFDILHPAFLSREWVDPASLKAPKP